MEANGSNTNNASLPQSTHLPSKSKAATITKAKAMNVFSSDGTFLDRFSKLKEAEIEKKKQDDALQRKKQMEDRIRRRGKRPRLDDDSVATKKRKQDETEENAYLREVRKLGDRHLKDDGSGVTKLMK